MLQPDPELERYREWQLAAPLALFSMMAQKAKQTITYLFTQFSNLFPLVGGTAFLTAQTRLTWWQAILFVSVLILLVIVVTSIIAYRRFRFKISEESISVKSGVIKLTEVDVRWDRVRAVNFEQGPIERRFKYAQVSFDTAGSVGVEIELPAIKLSLAEKLSLLARANQTKQEATVDEATTDDTTLYKFSFGEIVRGGLCSSGTLVFFVGIIGAFFTIVPRLLTDFDIESSAFEVLGTHISLNDDWLLIFFIIPILLVLLVFVTRVVVFVVVNHGFTVFNNNQSISTKRGFFTQKSINVSLDRVQSVRLKFNIRHRLLDMGTLSIFQSAGVGTGSRTSVEASAQTQNPMAVGPESNIELPLTREELTEDLMDLTMRDQGSQLILDPTTQEYNPVSPIYFFQMLFGVICNALVIFLAIMIVAKSVFWALCTSLPIILVGSVFSFVRWRKTGYVYDDSVMIFRTGFIGYVLESGKLHKVQSIRVKQSLIQKFTDRSTLSIKLATVELQIPFLDISIANQIRDYLLHLTETRFPKWK